MPAGPIVRRPIWLPLRRDDCAPLEGDLLRKPGEHEWQPKRESLALGCKYAEFALQIVSAFLE